MANHTFLPMEAADREVVVLQAKIWVDGSGSVVAQDGLHVSVSNEAGRGAYKLNMNMYPASPAKYLTIPTTIAGSPFQSVSDPLLGIHVDFVNVSGSASPAFLSYCIASSSLQVSASAGPNQGFSFLPSLNISGSATIQLLSPSGSTPGNILAVPGLAASGSAIDFIVFVRNSSTPRKGV